jgi:glucosamine-6-phosphate deaminase
MDEYCDETGKALSVEHPLSFKRQIRDLLLNPLQDEKRLNKDQLIFPDEQNIHKLAEKITMGGGIDTCYGGVGIHGHLAFNEPEEGVSQSDPRKVRLNDFTITLNAIRSQVGGNLECYPKEAYTLGLRQCLGAKRIRLFCRNGISLDWANTVLRLALFGSPGDDYPVTHIRPYDYLITTDWDTLAPPKYLI